MKPDERFWAKVDKSGGPDACWPWIGYVRDDGYGYSSNPGRSGTSIGAHRRAYELTLGELEREVQVDHACHNDDPSCPGGVTCLHRRCCNPAHLEAAASLANNRRRFRDSSSLEPATCRHGHPLDERNLYTAPSGKQKCRACANEEQRRLRERRRASV